MMLVSFSSDSTHATSGVGTTSSPHELIPVYKDVRVAKSQAFYVVFGGHCCLFFYFSLDHCIVCFAIDGFF